MALRLSWLGTACVSVTSLCFIAAAFLPTDLYRRMHNLCVNAAFLMFLIAVVLLFLAILLQPGFPRRFAWIFGLFLVLLAGYILLLIFGPAARTPAGEIIQATGQKIIVYASILTIFIQALSVQPNTI
jgi:predicted anti-sigma-YlaC factor YlaD